MMKKSEEIPVENQQPDIKRFLLRDTVSLRNEIEYTDIEDLVHPLTFSYDLKKHPHMSSIPVLDKFVSEELKQLVLDLIKED